ncbi:uncharacterized protein LOC133803953 isoform X2 [Humulus lupulus]|uniref:uncharacterized protein LOC133803953 isoform X2 n=1 Tax=Humulus lupulus TaxID=3486 RepID=UPI002B4125F3|nr:uncharacterized protein LOC133803953 isoform X2 [Humulus lupulus]
MMTVDPNNSAPHEPSVPELSLGESPLQEQRSVRRRLVQATLFPLKPKPQDRQVNEDLKCERDCDEILDSKDEEYCESQNKRKRKPKRNSTPPEKASGKAKGKRSTHNVPQKSPTNVQSEDIAVVSPDKEAQMTTPKVKLTAEGTASRKARGRGSANSTPKKNSTITQTEDVTVVIPDLRLEARLTAQENSRMSAGKKLHPFFSSWKEDKKNREVIDVEGNKFAVGRQNKEKTFTPIHVFERSQDTDMSLDWGTWKFSEEIFMKSIWDLESSCQSIFEGSIECLSFQKFHVILHPDNASSFQDKVFSDDCVIQEDCIYETLPTDDETEDSEINKLDSFGEPAGVVRKQNTRKESRFLEDRMKSYYLGCDNQLRNSLWTYSYQPKTATEVCGNADSVKFLSVWLQQWRERNFQICSDLINCDTSDGQKDDYICSESDSDSGSQCEEDKLKNVLLVTGPVGSGKSAAIYACAKEQGFEVLEVNASECRNGAYVRQKFGEALQSRRVIRHVLMPSAALVNGSASQEYDVGIAEVIALSDEDRHIETGVSGIFSHEEAGSCSYKSEVKPLILFEDVDITFLDDRGFMAAVQQIADTAKGPIILTSNSHKPLLPDNLDRLEICFSPPSPEMLLCHAHRVCAAERANIQPHVIEQVIDSCQGDIRKMIMHLQFWGQGNSSKKGKKNQRAYGSLLFNLEAGHQILPKLIPWDLSSELSELVEKEIAESLSREDNSKLMDIIEDKHAIPFSFVNNNVETETIEAKKEAMLNLNCSVYDYDEFRSQLDTREVSDNLDSPFSCIRQNVRKKHDVVSSDSEDEFVDNGCPMYLDEDTHNEPLFGRSPLFKEQPGSVAADVDERLYHHSDSAGCIPLNGECKSVDVSCVPESSFVPETEINDCREQDVTDSCGFVGDTLEEVSMTNKLLVENEHVDITKPEIKRDSDTLLSNHGVIAQLFQQEEVEDSQNEHVEAVAIGYQNNQILDECSRMDCSRTLKCVEKPKPLLVPDLVQHSWNQLRRRHTDLSQYASSEEDALQVVQLTHKMTNLISDTDVLLPDRQPLTSDSLEPSVITSEESDAYSSFNKSRFASTTAQHGFCLFAKDIAAVGSRMGSACTVDLTSMLGCATGPLALAKLAEQDTATSRTTWTGRNSELNLAETDVSFKSENKSHLVDVVQSIVPSKSLMTLKGSACYEYLSSLRCISKSEASRLSNDTGKPRKRRRWVDRHYLSTGTLMLSPEEISALGKMNMPK